MANNLTMYIGAEGVFNLEAPYSALMPTRIVYTCKAIRKLTDIIATGVDPFLEYYQSSGISKEVYDTDLEIDVSIVSLVSTGGDWVYVPSTAIISFPDITGVLYTAMMLGVSLGALPDNTNLAPLKTGISNMVRDFLGVTPTIKEIAVSNSALIPYVTHDTIETVRTSIKTIDKTDTAKLINMIAERDALLLRVTQLEAYIQTLL